MTYRSAASAQHAMWLLVKKQMQIKVFHIIGTSVVGLLYFSAIFPAQTEAIFSFIKGDHGVAKKVLSGSNSEFSKIQRQLF